VIFFVLLLHPVILFPLETTGKLKRLQQKINYFCDESDKFLLQFDAWIVSLISSPSIPAVARAV
jgi:hypothetical protein